MSSRSRALRAAQTALDERRDPLADPELHAALEAEPEAYADVERLLDRLELLARAPVPNARSTRPISRPLAAPLARGLSLAAGAALAIGMGLLAASMPERHTGRDLTLDASFAAIEPGSAGEVLDFHVSIARTSPTEQRFVFNDNGHVTHEHRYTETDRTTVVPAAPRVTIRHRQVVANRR